MCTYHVITTFPLKVTDTNEDELVQQLRLTSILCKEDKYIPIQLKK